jgi:hypothetical protein
MSFWITQNADPASSDGNTQFLRVCFTPLTADPTDLYGDLWYRSDLGQLRQYIGGVAQSIGAIAEAGIAGLVADLAARPVKGPGYAADRAAIINATGALEAASGSPGDFVHVDGTSGPGGVSAPAVQTSRTGAHSFGTTYSNPGLTPMMVTVVVGLHAGDSVIAYSDLSSPPTSRVQSAALMASAGTGLLYIPLSFWVMHGAYYRLVAFGGTPTTNEWMEWN